MTQSLTERQRGELFVVAGFLLLLNPFVVGALDLGDPDSYTYEPKEVSFFDNGTYDVPVGLRGIDPQVACFEAPRLSRSCALERAVHANGGLTYGGPPEGFIDSDYWYVHVWDEGFFEPVAEETENGTIEYGLEPVAQSRALDSVAVSSDDASAGVRRALESGQYRTSDPLGDADELVAHDGSYYVVTAVAYRTTTGERRPAVVVLQWIAGIVGAWFILRGQRLRVAGTG